MNLGTKLMLSAAIAVLCATIGSAIISYVILHDNVVTQTRDQMHAIMKQAHTVRDSIDEPHTHGAFDIAKMAEEAKRKQLRYTALYLTIPVVAAWDSIPLSTSCSLRVVR
jgi:hypothetical protein